LVVDYFGNCGESGFLDAGAACSAGRWPAIFGRLSACATLMTRFWILLFALCANIAAQPPDAAFFESKIRPILATKCYSCHSSNLKAPMGGLQLDSKAGIGRVVVPGKPAGSRLLQAIRYTDPHLQMPPNG